MAYETPHGRTMSVAGHLAGLVETRSIMHSGLRGTDLRSAAGPKPQSKLTYDP